MRVSIREDAMTDTDTLEQEIVQGELVRGGGRMLLK